MNTKITLPHNERNLPITLDWLDAITGETQSMAGLRGRTGMLGRINWEYSEAWRRVAIWLNGEICSVSTCGQFVDLCTAIGVDLLANFEPQLRVVRAAIRDDNGGVHSVPAPGRHHDVIREMRKRGFIGFVSGQRQGFLLNNGTFVRRKTAYKIAKEAGQLKNGNTIATVLTSEDLW